MPGNYTHMVMSLLGGRKRVIILFIAYVFAGIGSALTLPIYSLFVKSFVHTDAGVGIVLAAYSSLWIITTLVMTKVLKFLDKVTAAKIALCGVAVCYALLSMTQHIWQFLIIETVRTVFMAVMYFVFGLFIREMVSKKDIGKLEGISFALFNLAFLIGPFLGGILARDFGFSGVFWAAAGSLSIALITLVVGRTRDNGNIYDIRESIFHNIKDYFRNKNLALTYLMSCGIILWWVLLYSFVPLFVKARGMSESAIGIALALYALPLLILEIPAGAWADRLGYRRFFILGFSFMGCLLLFASFTDSAAVFFALIILGCIGAAFIEPLREAYLFKISSTRDEMRMYGVFKTSIDAAHILGPLIFAGILFASNGSYQVLYVISAFIMMGIGASAIMMTRAKDISQKAFVEVQPPDIGKRGMTQ